MFGNIREYCLDSHIDRHCKFEQPVNPICLKKRGKYIVTRGGDYNLSDSLEFERIGVSNDYGCDLCGLRLCLSSYRYKNED